jgi:phosphatidylserine decarboxylase
MSEIQSTTAEVQPRAMPENVTSIQPGSGVCCRIEQAWGGVRRWYLPRFRAAYVRRMAACRVGSDEGAGHEILDPRDLKYCRNQCTAQWQRADDPFHWRRRLPFARWGLAELLLIGGLLLAVTIVVAASRWWPNTLLPAAMLGLVVYFFRDPPRTVPTAPGLIVSPADGTVAEVTEIDDDPFVTGPAVRVGIFLSIFNVHLNRSPVYCRVIGFEYKRGKYLNALRPQSALENENMRIDLQQPAPTYRRMAVRQIAGAIARRIVCDLRPGEMIDRGERFGMIKLGSRTELILPREEGLEIMVTKGQKMKAGSSVIARYPTDDDTSADDTTTPMSEG